jgi:hypothetical protein
MVKFLASRFIQQMKPSYLRLHGCMGVTLIFIPLTSNWSRWLYIESNFPHFPSILSLADDQPWLPFSVNLIAFPHMTSRLDTQGKFLVECRKHRPSLRDKTQWSCRTFSYVNRAVFQYFGPNIPQAVRGNMIFCAFNWIAGRKQFGNCSS